MDNVRQTAQRMIERHWTVLEMLAAYDRGEIDENGDPITPRKR